MLQSTVDRIEPLIPHDRIWVITNERYVDLVRQQVPELPGDQVVGEPVARNTAPCVAVAAALLKEKDPNATMLVLPADHLIESPDTFRDVVEATAGKMEEEPGALVTIGIKPDRPETGYGYIECSPRPDSEKRGHSIFEVRQFREKPDRAQAQEFLDSGNFLWNSGMFTWKADGIINQFEKHLPEIAELLTELESDLGDGRREKGIASFYEQCPSISIDYGIMEKADTVFVVPGDFGWNDVGSWRAVYDLREKDENGNVVQADLLSMDSSSGNLIQSSSGKMIAMVGMENTAVVETDTAILICNLNEAQGVKQIVEQLREKKEGSEFL